MGLLVCHPEGAPSATDTCAERSAVRISQGLEPAFRLKTLGILSMPSNTLFFIISPHSTTAESIPHVSSPGRAQPFGDPSRSLS